MNTPLTPGSTVAYYRRLYFMTQEELAKKLGITSQAISKWEQGITSPDISLLPVIADVFNISVDELFGREQKTEPVFDLVDGVPWEDDGKIRFAVFHGKKLMHQTEHIIHTGENTIDITFDNGKLYKINGSCRLNRK